MTVLPQNFARVQRWLDEKAGGIVVVEDIQRDPPTHNSQRQAGFVTTLQTGEASHLQHSLDKTAPACGQVKAELGVDVKSFAVTLKNQDALQNCGKTMIVDHIV